nr:hypothetical protein [Sicyoidochytrium minutum DNA virus]
MNEESVPKWLQVYFPRKYTDVAHFDVTQTNAPEFEEESTMANVPEDIVRAFGAAINDMLEKWDPIESAGSLEAAEFAVNSTWKNILSHPEGLYNEGFAKELHDVFEEIVGDHPSHHGLSFLDMACMFVRFFHYHFQHPMLLIDIERSRIVETD